ncbi:MAG: CCXG family PEP-CTERM protein [Pseudomonadota bacterium]
MKRTLLFVTTLLFAFPAFAWWDCAWDYRFAVDIAPPPGPPLTDYEVRLDLNAGLVPAEFDWSSGGDDLRAIDQDNLTELVLFVESWDEFAETATVWVRVPVLSAAGRRIYLYFGGPAGTASASSLLTFTETGLRFNTRNSGADPVNRASAEAAFDAAPVNTPGYGCAIIDSYTGVSNRSLFAPPNRNTNIALFAEAFFEVSAADAGVWEFRYGADFGRGGGLYVDDVALEEAWNTDLWWANNWNNASEVLQGSISLSAGSHNIRIIGFEGCCDGGLTAQFRRPGGAWQALAVANLNLVSRQCPTSAEPALSFAAGETANCAVLGVERSSQTLFDPVNNASNPKAVPGALMLNRIELTNTGPGSVDASSVVITEAIAVESRLRVIDFDGATAGPLQFVDGALASGLTYSFVSLSDPTDDLAFSNDGGLSFNYTPVPDVNGIDPAVTHIRITPQGVFQAAGAGGVPAANFLFQTGVQ